MTHPRQRSGLWLPLALLVVAHVALAARDGSALRRGEFVGTDGYMRLVRVEALYETGDWHDTVVRRSNAPYGEALHWTRPFDVLLLAGAAPLAPILGFRTALYWWGTLVSPVLHVFAMLALLWAARPLFDRQGLVYLGVVAVAQPAILFYFATSRPDHHGLIGLLFVVGLGFVLRLLGRPFEAGTAIASGAAAAALLWVSVEGLLPVAVFLGATGLAWIGAKEAFARKNLLFSAALVAGLAVALFVERPLAGLGAEEYDRFSLVHVFVFATIAGFWLAAWALEAGTPLCDRAVGRAAVALVGAAAAGGVVWLVFPKFFGGPLVDVDPGVVALGRDFVGELEPLIDAANPARTLREVVFFLGPALLAVPFLFHLIYTRRGAERRIWVGVALGLAVFVPLALFQRRWGTYAEFFMVLPYAALVLWALNALDAVAGGARSTAAMSPATVAARAAARALIVVAFATWFIVLAAAISRLEPGGAKGSASCPVTAMATYLGEAYGGAPRRILSFVFFGPEILYRTPHQVVGTPYQRNVAGILDSHDFFSAADDRTARKIVERRGVDLVLICPLTREATGYAARDGEPTLYARLERDEPPDWLRSVALPAQFNGSFLLFEVTKPKPAAR